MNLPNKITLLRVLIIPLLVTVLLITFSHSRIIAAVLFTLIALSDYLDGYLARKLDQVTALGKFLDPLADKVLVFAALICLIELRIVSSVPVIILLIRDLMVSAIRMSASSSGKIIAADKMGKYKTVVLDVAVVMLILNLPYSTPMLWLGVALSVVSGVDYLLKNKEVMIG